MSEQPTDSFGYLARHLRRTKGASHADVAAALGVAKQTSSNLEHFAHKVIGRPRVERMAAFYGLDAAQREDLLARWDRLPKSAYSEKLDKTWSKRNQVRSKAKHHDALQVALVEILALYLGEVATDPCTCADEDPFTGTFGRTCEVCAALAALGYPTRWNGAEPVTAFLGSLQEELASPA